MQAVLKSNDFFFLCLMGGPRTTSVMVEGRISGKLRFLNEEPPINHNVISIWL